MRDLLNKNRERVLSFNKLVIICIILILSSILIIKREQYVYLSNTIKVEIADGTEYRYLLDRLEIGDMEAQKLIEKYDLPQRRLIVNDIDIKDFLLVRNINEVLNRVEIVEGESFFDHWNRAFENQYGEGRVEKIDNLLTGYCEGWKVLLRNIDKMIYLIWSILCLVLLPIMKEDERLGTKDLVESCLYGKETLFYSRIINAFEIGIGIFFAGIALFISFVLLIYGVEGWDLLIQNTQEYVLFPFQVNFLQYLIYKLVNGFCTNIFVVMILVYLGDIFSDIRVSIALVLAYVSVHLTLGKIFLSWGGVWFAFLSPLQNVVIEDLLPWLSFDLTKIYFVLSIIGPLLFTGLLWILFKKRKIKSFERGIE